MPRSRATRAFAMPVLTSRIASSLNSWVYHRRSCVSPFSMKHLPVDHRTLRRYPGNWGKPKLGSVANLMSKAAIDDHLPKESPGPKIAHAVGAAAMQRIGENDRPRNQSTAQCETRRLASCRGTRCE